MDATGRWVAELDAMGSYGSLDVLRHLLEEAPEGVKQSPDYWYARGVLDTRTEAELAPARGAAYPARLSGIM